jgi:hypothetical protein
MASPRHVAALLVLASCIAGCGSSGSSGGAGRSPRGTPSPTPTLPTKAADAHTATRALLSVSDIGQRWVKLSQSANKKHSVKGKKGEYCPGSRLPGDRDPARADVARTFTLGTKTGADIFVTEILTFAEPAGEKWHAALAATLRDCHAWRAREGNYVVSTTLTDPPSVTGADDVQVEIQRIYADAQHKQLQYVRQTAWASAGRTVSLAQLAFITDKKDPQGKNLDRLIEMANQQVAKVADAFPTATD